MAMKKEVSVQLFDKEGTFVGQGAFEFDSKFNKPRKTFMPDAVRQFEKLRETGAITKLQGIAEKLTDHPGTYRLLLNDRYGYPVLLPLVEEPEKP